MQIPVLPTGAIPYLSTKCSPIIPVLIPQHQAGGSYAVYMHPTSLRPQPTSLAVRSMTFESPGSANTKTSPAATASSNQTNQPSLHSKEPTSPSTLKRACGEKSLAGSPSKLQRIEPKVRLCEEYRAWGYIYVYFAMYTHTHTHIPTNGMGRAQLSLSTKLTLLAIVSFCSYKHETLIIAEEWKRSGCISSTRHIEKAARRNGQRCLSSAIKSSRAL